MLPPGQSSVASIFSLHSHFKSRSGKAYCRHDFLMQGHGDAPTELRYRWGGGLGGHNRVN